MQAIVRTSEKDWLEKALKLYSKKASFKLIDDRGLGITEADLKSAIILINSAKSKSWATWQQIAGTLAGLGITGAGVWMVYAAIVDPEPTTKLGLLIAGGIVLALTGALGTLTSLGVRFLVSARSPHGHEFIIRPE